MVYCAFFFSSRRRHTRLTCDWSSDVCSSDLVELASHEAGAVHVGVAGLVARQLDDLLAARGRGLTLLAPRSEERRVGKECRSRRSPYHLKKKNNLMISVRPWIETRQPCVLCA